jgi:hypothetical protein
MGPRKCKLLATPCAASSLALVALGGSNPTGRFAGPSAIVRSILDMVAISRDVESASCEELGWLIKLMFTVPFYSA